MHLLRWLGQCTCCGGAENALAAVAWAMHLLRWRGQCTCCGGLDNALAAVAWAMHFLRSLGYIAWKALDVVARAARKSCTDTNLAE